MPVPNPINIFSFSEDNPPDYRPLAAFVLQVGFSDEIRKDGVRMLRLTIFELIRAAGLQQRQQAFGCKRRADEIPLPVVGPEFRNLLALCERLDALRRNAQVDRMG